MSDQKEEQFNPFDPTGAFKEVRNATMNAWAKTMVDMVNTDAYSEASGSAVDAWLASSAPFRQAMQKSMSQALTGMNLPVRDDVTRLAERLTNIEMRLDDLDAKLDETLQALRQQANDQ